MSCCETKDVMLLACSGGSNVGQIANDAAKALDRLGQGKMFCAIGVGADLDTDKPMVTFAGMAKKAGTVVAIDGCGIQCVAKALLKVGLKADVEVIATDLGIEKGHHFDYSTEQVALVGDAVTTALAAR